jgi:hypothetical protein
VLGSAIGLFAFGLIWGRVWVARFFVRRVIDHIHRFHPEQRVFADTDHTPAFFNPYDPAVKQWIAEGSAGMERDDMDLDQLCRDARAAYTLSRIMFVLGWLVFIVAGMAGLLPARHN